MADSLLHRSSADGEQLSQDQQRILNKIELLKAEGPVWNITRPPSTPTKPELHVFKTKHVQLNTDDPEYAEELRAWAEEQLAREGIAYPWGPATVKAKKQLGHRLLLIPAPMMVGIGEHKNALAEQITRRIVELAREGHDPREAVRIAREELAPGREWLVAIDRIAPGRGNSTVRVRHVPRSGPPHTDYAGGRWRSLATRTQDEELLKRIVRGWGDRLNSTGGDPRSVLEKVQDEVLGKELDLTRHDDPSFRELAQELVNSAGLTVVIEPSAAHGGPYRISIRSTLTQSLGKDEEDAKTIVDGANRRLERENVRWPSGQPVRFYRHYQKPRYKNKRKVQEGFWRAVAANPVHSIPLGPKAKDYGEAEDMRQRVGEQLAAYEQVRQDHSPASWPVFLPLRIEDLIPLYLETHTGDTRQQLCARRALMALARIDPTCKRGGSRWYRSVQQVGAKDIDHYVRERPKKSINLARMTKHNEGLKVARGRRMRARTLKAELDELEKFFDWTCENPKGCPLRQSNPVRDSVEARGIKVPDPRRRTVEPAAWIHNGRDLVFRESPDSLWDTRLPLKLGLRRNQRETAKHLATQELKQVWNSGLASKAIRAAVESVLAPLGVLSSSAKRRAEQRKRRDQKALAPANHRDGDAVAAPRPDLCGPASPRTR